MKRKRKLICTIREKSKQMLSVFFCASSQNTYRCVECTLACWSRDTNFGVRKGVSTYSFASRSVSGLGAASVTGDICVSKCWLLFDWFDNVEDDVRDDIMGNAEPGGGGLRLEKLDDVNGTVIGRVVVWNLYTKKRRFNNIKLDSNPVKNRGNHRVKRSNVVTCYYSSASDRADLVAVPTEKNVFVVVLRILRMFLLVASLWMNYKQNNR